MRHEHDTIYIVRQYDRPYILVKQDRIVRATAAATAEAAVVAVAAAVTT